MTPTPRPNGPKVAAGPLRPRDPHDTVPGGAPGPGGPPARRLLLATALPLLLAACAGPALPPQVWARLPLDAPVAASATGSAPAPVRAVAASPGWRLQAVTLPGHLAHDTVRVPAAGAANTQLVPLGGLRWAEPLAEAVPRLLRRDLERTLGLPFWMPPYPAETAVAGSLRVDLLALELAPGGRVLQVAARYTIAGASPAPARSGEINFAQPLPGSGAEALVLAHRAAIAELALRLAAQL
jgi:uncharacterized protein